jgi:polyphosphate kinase
MSWLAFNERVIDQAAPTAIRCSNASEFLAIAANNLDEFFMVRVAALARDHQAGVIETSPDGLAIGQQRCRSSAPAPPRCWTISSYAGVRRYARCWRRAHRDRRAGRLHRRQAHLESKLSADVCPVPTPLAFDPGHPFPYISNRSNNLAVVVEHRGRTKFARVKMPDTLPRFVAQIAERDQGDRFAMLEDVVRLHLGQLFPGVTVTSAHLFRVLRDTALVVTQDERRPHGDGRPAA